MQHGVPLQEKEKLYVELKGILARQPGPEVAEQLSIYQVCVCVKHMCVHTAMCARACTTQPACRKMQHMSLEANMYMHLRWYHAVLNPLSDAPLLGV
jgi:hypothetical protein